MKARIYYIEKARHLGVDIEAHNKVFNSVSDAENNIPKGYKTARYGCDTLVIVPNEKNFEEERYGEIGYIYTGFAA